MNPGEDAYYTLNPNQAENFGYFERQILPNAGHLRVTVRPDGVYFWEISNKTGHAVSEKLILQN